MKTKPKIGEEKPDPIPSLATIDPIVNLGCAIVIQALKDLCVKNSLLKSVDALCWLIVDGYELADDLGFSIPFGQILGLAVKFKEINHARKF